MSIPTEQATRIEAKLDQLVGDVSGLKTDVSTLKTDVSTLKSDVSVLKTDVSVLKTDVSILKTDVSVLKADVVDLRVHMGVLHEAAMDQIKLVAEGQQALREHMTREFRAQDERFDNRLRPLEDTVRAQSAELKRRR